MNDDTEFENLLIKKDNSSDYFAIKIEKYLEEIKKDLRHLPCQSRPDDCLQDENIKKLKEEMETSKTILPPIITQQAIIDEKQDIQQLTLTRIEKKMDDFKEKSAKNQEKTQEEIGSLKLSITQLQTTKDTKADHDRTLRERIAWILGIAGALIMLYQFYQGLFV